LSIQTIVVGAIAGKPGRSGCYGVKVDGTDTWLEFPEKPAFPRLSEVRVKLAADGKTVERFKVEKEGNPPPKGQGGGFKGGGGRKADPQREERIVAQHSQEMGLRMAELVLAHDAAKLGAKTKTEERKAMIESLVDEYSARFYHGAFKQTFLDVEAEVEADLADDDDDDGFGDEDDAGMDGLEDDNLWD
jgi:hypothetical protein